MTITRATDKQFPAMKIDRRFTKDLRPGQSVFDTVEYARRTSRISNPDGSVVFEMTDAEVPASWSQLATDIMVSKYFRKAGVPQTDERGNVLRHEDGTPITGAETSARQTISRLAGCWRMWGETHGYFDSAEDAQAFYDELCHMLLHQMVAPNSPQWFNTGLHFAYGITGPAQGHHYCDPKTGELKTASNAYEHPQPHACFIQSVSDDLVNAGGIMDLWTREARLFKYGSGTGTNFTKVRGEDEKLSGGGKSSGLMSFLKIGDRAAGAIKSGGTTRRAAKMVCLDLDHPDIESFVNWKVREELKVAALVEGLKVLPKEQRELAEQLGLKLSYDFNGEAYYTVSGQNSNNSVRIPNSFFKALEDDGDWTLYRRVDGGVHKTVKARELWDQIAFAAWRCADPGVQYDTTINQWHTCPVSGPINASNPCVTGDTRVLTPGGIWRRIDSMIHLPSRVVTNLDAQEIHVVEGAFPTGEKDVFELSTEGGYKLKLTADHKVWTRGRGWVEAQNLTRNDEVKLVSQPAAVQQPGEPTEPMLFHLVGFLLSDANGGGAEVDLSACGLSEEQVEGYARYVSEHWGEAARARNSVAVGDTATDGDTVVEVAPSRCADRRMLGRLGAFIRTPLAGGRRLSNDAFTSGLAAQKHLLRGLFTADGIVTGETVGLRSPRLGLLEDVQLLLLGFGIRSGVVGEDGDAVLRVDPRCLKLFAKHVAVLPGEKLADLATLIGGLPDELHAGRHENWERVAGIEHLGVQQVFDLTEPVTASFVANGITVHNCSEYMFLDDTACNLASLNVLTFYDAESRAFDLDAYKHGIRLWTVVLEISVLMASFPSEKIAELSYRYRTLGLGYANLGAMLMQAGIAYDSDAGRAICAALSSVMTGESYATSAEMAAEHGAFEGYADNREAMLRVIRNHRRAATGGDDYESLDVKPVAIDAGQFDGSVPLLSKVMLHAARACWDRALELGETHGYRNAQTTVIAPTGTIGLLMDCDTTGVEPDFALVKFKKLAGGGYFKIANQSVRPALASLGYSKEQADDVLRYVLGTLRLDAEHVNRETLKVKGLTDADLDQVDKSLPGAFELGFAFSVWTLPAETLSRLGVTPEMKADPGFSLLRHLGYTRGQIDAANLHACGRGTVEGSPHLKQEHYDVFDCANKCGKLGTRYIAATGHIRMMAAAQPFISGAISKTINLPNEAGVDEIKEAYRLSWQLGLKANALYRDGSKLSQPLNVKSDAADEEDEDEDEDEDAVESARDEVASDVVRAATSASAALAAAPNDAAHDPDHANVEPVSPRVIEKIVERVVHRPLRRKLADTRDAKTHKFDVAGHEGYITVGLYEDGTPGEIFITMNKEGSTVGGLMDTIATLASLALQYGVKVEDLVRKFEHVRFEPSGMSRNSDIPMAKSLVDYIFRWLGMEFVPGYRAANAPRRTPPKEAAPAPVRPSNGNGNGNGHKHAAPDTRTVATPEPRSMASAAVEIDAPAALAVAPSDAPSTGRFAAAAMTPSLDPLSLAGTAAQADAPACDVCGSITVRSGTCYKCLNCGNSMGCS